jgi:predicted DNA-binding transcriptional regulator YafY
VTGPTARRLALLALLQTRRERSGRELAERLGVTQRTIRTDVDRLRELGYPVHARRGNVGGYRLGAGGTLPPLLLDDEEAVAVTIGLQVAAGIAGIEDVGARALAKIEQVLPAHLRPTVEALSSAIDRGQENVGTDAPDPEVDADALRAVAAAIRDVEWLRFDYDDSPRLVEPYRLLSWQRRWHLVARDPEDGSWGTYRVDWMTLRMPTRRRFSPHPLPGGDYTAFAMRTIAASGWAVHARLRIGASAESVLDRINPTVGVVEPIDADTCVLVTGADSLDTVAAYIGMLMMDFTVESPPELIPRLRLLSERYARAVAGSGAA